MKRNTSRSRKQGKPSGLVRGVGCYSRALGRQDSAGPKEGRGGQGWEEGFPSQATATPTKKGSPARNTAPPGPDPTRTPPRPAPPTAPGTSVSIVKGMDDAFSYVPGFRSRR